MYLQKRINTALATVPGQPARTAAELAREGQQLGSFTVKATAGFSIGTYHKFKFFKRNELICIEYCKACSSARKFLMIDGEQVDYVQSALDQATKHEPATFNKAEAQKDFDALLKSEYSKYLK